MNSLQPPFSDIVGENSPVQKAIKMIWEIFANHPLPNNKSIASQSAAEQIVLHLLGTMNSIGMIPLYYSDYFADKEARRKLFEKLKYDIETIIKDFLNSIGSDKLYMDTPPELEGLSNRK